MADPRSQAPSGLYVDLAVRAEDRGHRDEDTVKTRDRGEDTEMKT